MMRDKRKITRCGICSALAAILLIAGTPAWGGALGRIQAIGARDISAGADPGGFQIPSNYAAKLQLTRPWAEAAFEAVCPTFTYESTMGRKSRSSPSVHPMPYLQYAEPLGDWGALGVDLKVPFGLGSQFADNPGQLGYDTATLLALVRLSPSLAVRLSDHWYASLALNIGMAEFAYRAPLSVGGACLPVYTDNEARGFGLGGGLGVMWKPDEAWTLGVNWTSALKAHMAGESRILRGPLQIRDDFTMPAVFPSRFDFGVTRRLTARLVLAFDYHFWNYSKTPNALTLDFDRLPLRKSEALAWKDGHGARIGAAWEVNDTWTLRASAGFLTQSIPDKTMSTLMPDTPGRALGLGVSCRLAECFTLDAGATRGGGSHRVRRGILGSEKYTAEVTTFVLGGIFTF
jgi:long-subunit fatty acid transport protein